METERERREGRGRDEQQFSDKLFACYVPVRSVSAGGQTTFLVTEAAVKSRLFKCSKSTQERMLAPALLLSGKVWTQCLDRQEFVHL